MILQFLGGSGIGLVWGWLAGLLARPAGLRLSRASLGAVLGGGAALAGLLALLGGWQAATGFLVAGLLAFLAHRSWRNSLSTTASSHPPSE
jgi:hypothetical protein